jgi:thioredoxin 1
MKNYICSIIFFTIFSFVFCSNGFSQILSEDDFEAKLKATPNAQLVDVRTSGEYGGGHLQKAKNIDFRGADFEQKIKTLDKSKPVFVYCLSGGRSKAASEILKKNGFNQVYDLMGGWLRWSRLGKPAEGVAEIAPGTNTGSISQASINALVAKGNVVVLDFYASWCGPCIKMMPMVEKISEEMKGKVTFLKIDADAYKNLVSAYNVDEIPTFIIFKNGKQNMRAIGLQREKDFKEMLE